MSPELRVVKGADGNSVVVSDNVAKFLKHVSEEVSGNIKQALLVVLDDNDDVTTSTLENSMSQTNLVGMLEYAKLSVMISGDGEEPC